MAKGEAGRQERDSSNNPAETQRWQRALERSAPPELYNRIHHVGERMFDTWTWACLKSRTIYTIKAKYDRIFLLLMLTIAHALYVVNKNNDETGTWFFHMLMLAQEAPWSHGCSYNFEIKTIWTGTRWHHHVIDLKVLVLTSSASGQEVRKESKIWATIKDKLLNNGVTRKSCIIHILHCPTATNL